MAKYEARTIFNRVMQARGAGVSLLQNQTLADFCPHEKSADVVGWLRGVRVALGVQAEINESVSVIIQKMMRNDG